jgi:hypothetical protein
VSDDFAMTRSLRASQRTIRFVPHASLLHSRHVRFHELVEFTTRQMKITRVYAPHLWKPVLLGSAIFVLVFLRRTWVRPGPGFDGTIICYTAVLPHDYVLRWSHEART